MKIQYSVQSSGTLGISDGTHTTAMPTRRPLYLRNLWTFSKSSIQVVKNIRHRKLYFRAPKSWRVACLIYRAQPKNRKRIMKCSPGSSPGVAAPIVKHQINPSKHTSESAASRVMRTRNPWRNPSSSVVEHSNVSWNCWLTVHSQSLGKEYSNDSQHDGRKSTIWNQCDNEI